jgi:virginiamycin A acetyltransferase
LPLRALWNWPIEAITEHIRTIWTGTPTELERVAERAGLARDEFVPVP